MSMQHSLIPPQTVFLMITLFTLSQVKAECRTPWGEIGHCVDIKNCPKLSAILKKQPLSELNEKILYEAYCGGGGVYKVCCAQEAPAPETVATTEKTQSVIYDSNSESCISLNEKEGVCIPIERCAKMMKILLPRPMTQENHDYLFRSHCGFEGIHPKVCCELDESSDDGSGSGQPVESPMSTEHLENMKNDACTSSGKRGDCINILQCKELLDLLQETPLTPEITAHLRSQQCGWEEKYPKVCCEMEAEKAGDTPEVPKAPEACLTPWGDIGECILVEDCTMMKKIYLENPRIAKHEKFLEIARCSVEDLSSPNFRVCCPPSRVATSATIGAPRKTPASLIADDKNPDKCITPENRAGDCVPVQQCDEIMKIFEHGPLTQEQLSYLYYAQCGADGIYPKVCCGNEEKSEEIDALLNPESPEILENSADGSCISLFEKRKRCVNLRECKKVVDFLKQTTLTPEITRYLRSLQCGWDDNDPKVCCEIETKDSGEKLETSTTPQACVTPWGDNNVGRCVRVEECKFVEKIYSEDPRSAKHEKLLQIVGCGSENLGDPNFRICCPVKRHKKESSGLTEQFSEALTKEEKGGSENSAGLPHDTCGPIPEARIIGGNGTGVHEFPWMALLGYHVRGKGIQYTCGGSLISDRYVLTAAHCLTALQPGIKLRTVRLGEYDMSKQVDCDSEGICVSKMQEFPIHSVKPHERYSQQRSYENDIGLVKLPTRIDFNSGYLRPICLPLDPQTKSPLFEIPENATVTGWGADNSNIDSAILQKVKLPILNNTECRKRFRHYRKIIISEKQMCAGGARDQDSCAGDSGGPLQAVGMYGIRPSYIQYGIVSFGYKPCGARGSPGIYTQVAHYIPWILDNMAD